MQHGRPALIEDIYADARIPAEACRPTFVKSLAMVPICRAVPIGAIGNYWATRHMPTKEVLCILQALANTTAVALQNAALYGELTRQLRELEEQTSRIDDGAGARTRADAAV